MNRNKLQYVIPAENRDKSQSVIPAKAGIQESGQALTEFVIVVPLMVMIFLFSAWFYELIHAKLKVQEAARYAAWEATAYPLHDYKDNPLPGPVGYFVNPRALAMKYIVQYDTATKYSNLDSSNQQLLPGRTETLFAAWNAPDILVESKREPIGYAGTNMQINPLIQGLYSLAMIKMNPLSDPDPEATSHPVAGLLIGSASDVLLGFDNLWGFAPVWNKWGFIVDGYVEAKVNLTLENPWFSNAVGTMLLPNANAKLEEKMFLLADSWSLNNGENVVGTEDAPGESDTKYWKQVDRMFFVGPQTLNIFKNNILRPFIDQLTSAATLAANFSSANFESKDVDDLVKTSVVSKSYGADGTIQIQQDNGPQIYDTAPATRGGGGNKIEKYRQARGNRGEYFMGCKNSMQLGCSGSGSLSSDNPFGPYINR